MSMQYETIIREDEDAIAWITLNRPQQMNSFGELMREELLHCFLALQDDDSVRVIVLTGAGRSFCAGGDIRHMLSLKEEGAGFEKLRPLLDEGRRIVSVIQELPKPVIAMVNGAASGAGMNLALACDIRVAGDHASFSQNFVHAGLHPDWGGSFFLPRLVGSGRALEMLWTGRRVEAEEAEAIGLVQLVVPHAHLREQTERFARRLVKAPSSVIRLTKLAVNSSQHLDLGQMLDFETEAQQQCWEAATSGERLKAMVERRRGNVF